VSNSDSPRARFPLGQLVATPGALAELARAGEDPLLYLGRHARGDWGTLSDADKKENEFSVANNFRILSAYELSTGIKIWIITEADSSSTCILLPSEY
jgi:hypothetical protein